MEFDQSIPNIEIQPEQCPGTWTEWAPLASATCNDTCGEYTYQYYERPIIY